MFINVTNVTDGQTDREIDIARQHRLYICRSRV